jgi:ABC-2 type transport system permease protein
MVFIMVFTLLVDISPEEELIPLVVVNLDKAEETANNFLEEIELAGGLEIREYDEKTASELLEAGEIDRVLTIPEGFSEDIEQNKKVVVDLVNDENASQQTTEKVLLVIEGVARDITLKYNLFASLEKIGEAQGAGSEDEQIFSVERNIAQAESQFERSRSAPLLSVMQTFPKTLDERNTFNGVQVRVPAFTILFVFLSAQATALSIYNEKKVGSFRRLLAAPISKTSLLLGKLLPNFVMALFQVAVIFTICTLVLPLLGADRLYLGNDIFALIVLSILIALCSTSIGILIAAVARTENQIGGLSSMFLWIMGAIGGSFIPTYFLGGFLEDIGRFTPHYWANLAFNDLFVRGRMLADLSEPIMAIAGFTLAFFLIGLWRFDFD